MHVKSVVILGGGSAGFLTAITLRKVNPRLPITVIRSKEIGVIGVGEATTVTLPNHLHSYLGLPLADFYARARPSWKLGILFLWGPRPWFFYSFARQFDVKFVLLPRQMGCYCHDNLDYAGLQTGLVMQGKAFASDAQGRPRIGNDVGYHLENVTFVNYLESLAAASGITVLDDTVVETQQDDHGVTGLRLASGPVIRADLYVDSSGFASVLLGRAMREPFTSFQSSLYNDRAVVGGWQRQEEPIKPYTTAETMDCGWCWQIDHEDRINRGYVYSSAFISDDQAEQEFRRKNPRVQSTRIVKYLTGRYQRGWVKNVIGIGNACGFVEPLESTGLAAICNESNHLAEMLHDRDGCVTSTMIDAYNKAHAWLWDGIRQFLAVHFKFNTRLDNAYWRQCREKADLAGAEAIVDYYRENGPSVLMRKYILPRDVQFDMDGYLSLLIGQQVPCDRSPAPTADELLCVQRVREIIRRESERGLTCEQTLRAIRSPDWNWPAGLYGNRVIQDIHTVGAAPPAVR